MFRLTFLIALLVVAPAGAQTDPAPAPYTTEQIQAAIIFGADGEADRFEDDCDAKQPGRGGFFGRIVNNPIVRSVVRERVSQTASGAAANALAAFGSDVTAALTMAQITAAAGEAAANGTLPPLPDEIRVTGEPPLVRVAKRARELRRTYRPLPEPDAAEVVEIIGDDLFEVRAWDYTAGIEYIVLQPRGANDAEGIVHPVSLAVSPETFTAQFPSAAVRSIVAENDVQAIVITPTAELRCNLDDGRLRRGFDPLRR